MSRFLRPLVVTLTGFACLFSPGTARAADDLKPEQVRTAIRKGRIWMLSKQSDDGSFEVPSRGHLIGTTSLAILALINSGMTPEDAEIKRGLRYLRRAKIPNATYDISLMLMALAAAHKVGDKFRIATLVERLETGQLKRGAGKEGGWNYDCTGTNPRTPDRSNSQFAVLALRDAAQAGVKVQKSTWLRVKKYWEDGQGGDYGWGYISKRGGSRGSMTVAGISSLVIVSRMLDDNKNRRPKQKPTCCPEYKPYRRLELAIKMLGNAMRRQRTVISNFGSRSHLFYYLYGLERAGRLSGRRFFGPYDWYREGAKYFVKTQARTGYWTGHGFGETDPLVGTSMALLFLSKGLAPVLINKLDYGSGKETDANWNRHRDDTRNLTEYITTRKQWPKLLTFQSVAMRKMIGKAVEAQEALDQAKVLFISGRESPDAIVNEPRMHGYLKEYVKRGGFILAVGNCDRAAGFDRGFRTLIRKMFTDKNGKQEAKLERLQKDHPIYRSEHKLKDNWKDIELWGVNYGCRTAIVYAPVGKDGMSGFDLSCYWNDWHISPGIEKHAWVDLAMKVGVNILAYATGREPPQKLREKDGPNSRGKNPIERGYLQVAKIVHTGDWDVAPRALGNLLRGMNRANGLTASTKQHNISLAGKNLFRHPVVYMHGRNAFSMSQKSRKQLKEYLAKRGGLLFADACCGSPAFDKSFRKLIAEVFPNKPLKRIPVKHELFNRKIGFKIDKVKRRTPESTNKSAAIRNVTKEVEPFLEGIEIEGRMVVIYSKYDISCALERQASISCSGYIEKDAMRIGINILMYALLQDVRYSRLFD